MEICRSKGDKDEDWAEQIRYLVDECYSDAQRIVLVMDNLNTHAISSLYEAFSPSEVFRISQKLEIQHTPKHGSWLNIAECELSALEKQCLCGSRIPDIDTLNDRLKPWATSRNIKQKGVNWQFSTDDARTRLKHLYPVIV